MAKKINYRPWIFFSILGAILITILVLLGRKESYTQVCCDEDDNKQKIIMESYGIRNSAMYATNYDIDKFSRYY